MPFLTNQSIMMNGTRTYHIYVPANPKNALLPAIFVFHGGGQEVSTIAQRWGIDPPNPVAPLVEDYILVFPEADPRLGGRWMHYELINGGFPTYDLDFVAQLLQEVTTTAYATGAMNIPTVSADPEHLYATGFSNGGGMVWQLLNSNLADRFRGFAPVAKALDMEKATHYRRKLASSGAQPAPAPTIYVQGTADTTHRPTFMFKEVIGEFTKPTHSVMEMMQRNNIPANVPSTTRLIGGSTNSTEVVIQIFQGAAAFAYVTIINGAHNWPTPTTAANPPVASHFNATEAVITFWQRHAGLP